MESRYDLSVVENADAQLKAKIEAVVTEPSPKAEPPSPIAAAGLPQPSTALVSCISRGNSKVTRHFKPDKIIVWVRSGKFRPRIDRIRSEFTNILAITNNDRKAAKDGVKPLKEQLPAVTWSATFSRRVRPVRDHLLQPSGLLCADLDGLGDQLAQTRRKLLRSIHLWALFVSPTGDGLKCVFRVRPNAEQHDGSFRAVEQHVRELTGIQIDRKCSDITRLCFLSYDPDAYLKEDAVEIPPAPEAEQRTQSDEECKSGQPKLDVRRAIATDLLGPLEWESDTSGYLTCPGQELHSSGDGDRDCQVYLDRVPTVYCFHESCLDKIAAVNRELRSRIAKAENGGQGGGSLNPVEWFNRRFPLLSAEHGDAVLIKETKDGSQYVGDISEDFLAATLSEKGTKDSPTVFVPTEQKFYTYAPDDGIYNHKREPELIKSFSKLLLDCKRESNGFVDTRSLEFRLRSSTKLAGVLKKAQGLLAVPDDFFSTGLTEFIPCANGMLRLSDRELLPFNPSYRRRNKLAVPFDPDGKCPVFLDTLLCPALDPEEIDLLQRWCGLALIGENIAQRFLILSGTAGGGKGTFIRVLVGIIGQQNVATLRTRLLNERFEIGRFLGKTLLYGADVPENFLNQRGASVLKSLTGYDPMTLEFKKSNESPIITGRFNAIVTCNSRLTVHLEGDTDAWRRRLAIISYEKPKPARVIADLDQLILRTEASGVLKWMLEGLDKIRADGWQLQLTPAQQRVVDNLLLESESHIIFAREALFPAPGTQLTTEDCHGAYLRFCSARGWIPLGRNKFSELIGDVVARMYGLTVRHDLPVGIFEKRGWKGLQVSELTEEALEKDLE